MTVIDSPRNITSKTLSFLFTDIEGSTRLLQKLGDKYTDLIDEHNKILKELVDKYEGEIIVTAGDGMFAVFESTRNAIECAASIQKAMLEHEWQDGNVIKLRMGIHTGEARISGNSYSGIDIHRAERIMSAGSGGQVLISESVKLLIENELPEEIEIKFLGDYSLKDLNRPERIYQLVIKGLRSDFPVLKFSKSGKTNLPSDIVKLIGREKEFDSLREKLLKRDTRLITITGPGGIGKTSLGLNVCSSLAGFFNDGIYLISLQCISSEEDFLPALAKVLEVSEASESSIVVNHLKRKSMLLFFDNFEQITTAAGVVKDIIAECPEIKILVTSRIPLHLQMEEEFSLNTLTVPEKAGMNSLDELTEYSAIRLFIERAKSVNKNFSLTEDNAEYIAAICIQLDGLPLAIELAAARIRLFSPQSLLSKLNVRLDILKGTNIDLPERHRTLRQTIQWSYELLSEEEKKMFTIMSVFSGGVTLDAIEYVCKDIFGSEFELIDSVEALVGKSLVRRIESQDGEIRFNMLFIIREFSLELLVKSEEYKNMKDRHAEFYLMNAEKAEPNLTGLEIKKWSDYIDSDIENYRAALKWAEVSNNEELAMRLCSSLWRFWIIRKNLKEGFENMKYVLAMPFRDSQKLLRAKVLNGIGTIMHEMNSYDEALPMIEESIKLFHETGEKRGELYAVINLYWVLINTGKLDEAVKYIELSLKMNEELNETRAYALIYNSLGWLNSIKGNLKKSKEYYLISLEKRIEAGDKRGEGFSYTNIAFVEIWMGEYESAERHLKKAIEIPVSLSDKHLESWGLSNLALLELQRMNFQKAKELVLDSIYKIKESLTEWGLSYETLLYGIILYELGDTQNGIENIEKSYSFYKKVNIKIGMRRALTALARVNSEIDDISRANEALNESRRIAELLGDKLGLIQNLEILGYISVKSDKPEDARKYYSQAASLRKEISAPMSELERSKHEKNLEMLCISVE